MRFAAYRHGSCFPENYVAKFIYYMLLKCPDKYYQVSELRSHGALQEADSW